MYSFSYDNILDMNITQLWKGTIKMPNEYKNAGGQGYHLHATGDADMRGRIYVAIPTNVILTDSIKKTYNIW